MNIIELTYSGVFSLMGVIIGAHLTQYLNKINFEKKKQGAEILIKSELITNIEYLKEYHEQYLGQDFNKLKEYGTLQDLDNFYYNLKYFPIITQKYWEKLAQFAPEIFEKEKLNLIMKFCIELNKLNQQVETLYTKEYEEFKNNIDKSSEKSSQPYCLEDLCFIELDLEGFDETISDWRALEHKFTQILSYSEKILKFI